MSICCKPLDQYHETKHHSCSSPPLEHYNFHETNRTLWCTSTCKSQGTDFKFIEEICLIIVENPYQTLKAYTEHTKRTHHLSRTNTYCYWLKLWNCVSHLNKSALSWNCTVPPIIKALLKSKWNKIKKDMKNTIPYIPSSNIARDVACFHSWRQLETN